MSIEQGLNFNQFTLRWQRSITLYLENKLGFRQTKCLCYSYGYKVNNPRIIYTGKPHTGKHYSRVNTTYITQVET